MEYRQDDLRVIKYFPRRRGRSAYTNDQHEDDVGAAGGPTGPLAESPRGKWTEPRLPEWYQYAVVPDLLAPRASFNARKHLQASAYPSVGERLMMFVDFGSARSAEARWELGKVDSP